MGIVEHHRFIPPANITKKRTISVHGNTRIDFCSYWREANLKAVTRYQAAAASRASSQAPASIVAWSARGCATRYRPTASRLGDGGRNQRRSCPLAHSLASIASAMASAISPQAQGRSRWGGHMGQVEHLCVESI